MELESITGLVDQRPFSPFVIELDNGRRVKIRHPENVIFFPSRAKLWHVLAYDEEENAGVVFHPSAVSALVESRGNGGHPS